MFTVGPLPQNDFLTAPIVANPAHMASKSRNGAVIYNSSHFDLAEAVLCDEQCDSMLRPIYVCGARMCPVDASRFDLGSHEKQAQAKSGGHSVAKTLHEATQASSQCTGMVWCDRQYASIPFGH